ncbi:MAG TPA: hypothetical protein VHC22_30845 [Pirellulales bacterium]|nr:hypothetical protein [Pirellulales bacterium]
MLCVGIARYRRRHRERQGNDSAEDRFHFSVADLLLTIVVACVPLAVVASLPPRVWAGDGPWEEVVAGTVLGLVTLAGVWVGLHIKRRRYRLAAVLLFPPLALVAAWIWLTEAKGKAGPRDRSIRAGRLLYAATISSSVALFWWRLAYPAFAPALSLTDAYGDQDLYAAAGMVQTSNIPRWWLEHVGLRSPSGSQPAPLPWLELQPVIAANEEALALADAALEDDIRIGLNGPDGTSSAFGVQINQLWLLAQVLLARGDLLREEGNIDAAADRYLEVLRLGGVMGHGPFLVHQDMGFRIESLALEGIRSIAQDLADARVAAIERRLLAFDDDRESTHTVALREDAYRDQVQAWDARWLRPLTDNAMEPRIRERGQSTSAALRLLVCHLALLRYRRANGSYPPTVAELVPTYLTSLPADPFSDGGFVYGRQGEAYRLYSVGLNGSDDGGRDPGWPLVLTSPRSVPDLVFDLIPRRDAGAAGE